jgi:prophage regulatory protein
MTKQNERPDGASARVLRIQQVCERIGVTQATIYSWLNNGRHGFPAPVRLGARSVGWHEAEIARWLENRQRVARATPLKPRRPVGRPRKNAVAGAGDRQATAA